MITDLEKASKAGLVPPSNVVFDESGNFILYPTMLGIKGVVLMLSARALAHLFCLPLAQ